MSLQFIDRMVMHEVWEYFMATLKDLDLITHEDFTRRLDETSAHTFWRHIQ